MRPASGGWALGALLALAALPLGAMEGIAPAPTQEDAPPASQGIPSDSLPQPGSNLRAFLLTLGRGDAIWEKFGHNAIWIQDEATGEGEAYNWGIFSFLQEDFIPRLIRGTMMYWMAPQDPYAMLEEAQRADRRVWIQELALTPSQKLDLLAFVRWNAQPQNAYYRYDYYRDNCSSRVRDALDQVLGGAIRAASDTLLTSHTYRWHTRRLLGDVPAAYLGIQVVLGPDADRPLTPWEEMFLPVRLMEELRALDVPDEAGGARPLVIQERVLRDADRPSEPKNPPFALPWFLGIGLLWGGGTLALARKAAKGALRWRLSAALLGGGWSLLASLAGLLLLGAWLFTDHVFWYRNLNLFQLSPLALPLIGAFLVYGIQGRLPGWGRRLAGGVAFLSLAGLVLELLPGLGQGNGEVLALTLPVNLGVWLAARAAAREGIQAPPEAAPGGAGSGG